jgi:hypothetical protein
MAPLETSALVWHEACFFIYRSINLLSREPGGCRLGFSVSSCCRFNLAQLAEGESGEGMARACSLSRVFATIRL